MSVRKAFLNQHRGGYSTSVQHERQEKCGVFGIFSTERMIVSDLYAGLVALQHRGQESAGIATIEENEIRSHLGMGLVSSIFEASLLQRFNGRIGIGHVRYSTTGESSILNAQPLVLKRGNHTFAIAFNGNILNYEEMKARMKEKGTVFSTSSDTELIALLFAESYEKGIYEAASSLMENLDGSYSLLILTGANELIAIRDPQGFKPFVLGKRGSDFVAASEKPALDAINASFVREILPGEVVLLHKDAESKVVKTGRIAHCFFEFVYFSRPDTIFGGKTPHTVREKLGRRLGKMFRPEVDVVIGVPDSGRSAALGYAKETGIPFDEGLIKNRYIGRTFIMPNQAKRDNSVKLKLNAVEDVLNGKRVALIDDSIVRGTTMRKIVKILREAGAKEVHVLISAPPIIAPCFMGVDFPTYRELVASSNSVDEIRKEIGADGLYYMTIEGLIESIGIDASKLCLACVTDEYPTRKRPAANG